MEYGMGWNTPTETLANAFEAGDPRKDETLLYFIKVGESPSLIPANQPYNEKPVATNDVIAKYFNKRLIRTLLIALNILSSVSGSISALSAMLM